MSAASIVKFDPWAGDGMYLNIGNIYLTGETYDFYTQLTGHEMWEFIIRTDKSKTELSLLRDAGDIKLELKFANASASVAITLSEEVGRRVLMELQKQINESGVTVRHPTAARIRPMEYVDALSGHKTIISK